MKIFTKFLQFNLFLAFILCFGNILLKAEPKLSVEMISTLRNSAVENEEQAEKLSKQWNGKAIRRSIDLYLEAADLRQQISDLTRSTDCLHAAARLYLLLGDYRSAFANLNRALEIDEKNNISASKVETLSLLSRVSLQAGQIENSKKYSDQALDLSQKLKNPESEAIALFGAAEFHYNQSNAEKPITLYEQSLALWRKAKNDRGELQTLISLSYAYLTNGNPLTGLDRVIQAKNKAQEIGDERGQAIAQILIGHINLVLDEKQAALNIYQKAEMTFPVDLDFLEKARLQNAIGSIYEDFGDWKLSFDYRLKAFELFKRENYLYGQLATLPSLGRLSSLLDDEAAAFRYFDEALKLAVKLNDSYYHAFVWKELGDLYERNNTDNLAVENYQKAQKIFQQLNAKRPILLIQNSLGKIFQKQGNLALALENYNAALQTSRESKNKFSESETLFRLAGLSKLENKDLIALNLAQSSIALTESLSINVLNSKLKSIYFSNVFDRYELYINLLMKIDRQTPNENYAVRALQAAERSRARAMLENLSLSDADFTRDADPETVKREKEIHSLLNLKADKLTDLLESNAEKSEAEKVGNEINELENELESIKGDLKQKVRFIRQSKIPPLLMSPNFSRIFWTTILCFWNFLSVKRKVIYG